MMMAEETKHMQTFLPFESYIESAKALDSKRLGKQRVEALQILQVLLGRTKGWRSHPAVKMWRGEELSLCEYGVHICLEWRRRGYKDSMLPVFKSIRRNLQSGLVMSYFRFKPWWLDDAFCEAHRSNLVRKDPEFYGKKFNVSPDLPYVWPSSTPF